MLSSRIRIGSIGLMGLALVLGLASLAWAQAATVLVDDDDAKFTGEWTQSAALGWFHGRGYHGDGNAAKGEKSARYEATLPQAGKYEVRVSYSARGNRANNVPVTITHADGDAKVTVDQQKKPEIDGRFQSLGTFSFGTQAVVVISNEGTDGHVIADAVQFVPAGN